jgi:hypothetical protein
VREKPEGIAARGGEAGSVFVWGSFLKLVLADFGLNRPENPARSLV